LRSKFLNDPAKVEGPDVPPKVDESPDSEAPALEHTGERFLPGTIGSSEIAYDHIARYCLAGRYVEGKKTIDLGCGAGYGTHALARSATDILGVDLSEEAIAYDSWSYQAPNLRYKVGDVTNLPYPDGSFEAAVSFEVIEHLERPESLVEEARRLLNEDGVFVVSTPDKQTYSNDRNSVNPHHLKEMYPLEFRELLERHFEHVRIYRQAALAGSIITPDSRELPEDGRLTLESAGFSSPEPVFGRELPTSLYMIAVCANGQPPALLQRPYALIDRDRQIYEEHADGHAVLGKLLTYQQHDRQASKQRIKQQQKHIQELQRAIRAMQNRWIWRAAQRLKGLEARVRRPLGRG
jgi:SAM-dependent methyltransferase